MIRTLFIIFLFPFLATAQTRITVQAGTGGGAGGGVSQSTLNDSTAAIRNDLGWTGTINNVSQRLNHLPFQPAVNKYNFVLLAYTWRNEDCFIVREGTEHTYNCVDSVYVINYRTSDKGNSYVKDTIHFEATVDSRNFGGGVYRDTIYIFYNRYKGPSCGNFISNRVMVSTDNRTFTHSGDLNLNGVTHEFSPFGPMQEADNGDLVQPFYGDSSTGVNAKAKVYTLRKSPGSSVWANPVNIKVGPVGSSLLYNETSIAHLGGGNWMAAIRKEEGLNKKLILSKSIDDAMSWTDIGQAFAGSIELPGVSPLIFKKDSTTAYLSTCWRGSVNAFGINEVMFGDTMSSTEHRIFYKANNQLGFGINFGYQCLLKYSPYPRDWAYGFYDSSPLINGVDNGTDVIVIPFLTRNTSEINWLADFAMNPSLAYYIEPQAITLDELAINNLDGDRTYYHIREDAVYNFQFKHNLTTTNATGTYRKVVFEKWNVVDNVLIEQMWEEKHYVANTGYAEFRFNFNYAIKAGETVRCYIEHDATGTVATGSDATNMIIINKIQ